MLVLAPFPMSLQPFALRWTSLVPETSSPRYGVPARLSTPERAWDFGAATDLVETTTEDAVVRLHVRGEVGVAGLSVVSANYGVQLTPEACVHAEDGDQKVDFGLPASLGLCRIVARTYGEEGRAATLTVLCAQAGRLSDLSIDEQGRVLHPARAAAPVLTGEIMAWAPTRAERFLPLGLGNTCEAKFQIARVIQFRRDPEVSEMAFRLAMLPPRRSEDRFGWELFDWQGTSLKAVLAYLERDFEGVFERADLQLAEVGVRHRELGTQHEHDFEVLLDDPRAPVTEAVIDQGYCAVRERFDAMVARFKIILRQPGPYLYVHVCEDIPSEWDVAKLVNALRAHSPGHRFRLLFVGYEGSDTPWGDYAHAVADKAFRPRTWQNPVGRQWEGPAEAWTAALAPYLLALPDGTPT